MNRSFNPSRAFGAVLFLLPTLVSAVLLGGCRGASNAVPIASAPDVAVGGCCPRRRSA
jgi:hypothetical protein